MILCKERNGTAPRTRINANQLLKRQRYAIVTS